MLRDGTLPLPQTFIEELLSELRDPLRAPEALKMLNQTNLLSWLASTPYFSSFLHQCAAHGYEDVLLRASLCVGPAASLDLRDEKGRACVHWAARKVQLLTLNRLLDLGANVRDVVTNKGQTVLHILAEKYVERPKPSRWERFRSQATAAFQYVMHSTAGDSSMVLSATPLVLLPIPSMSALSPAFAAAAAAPTGSGTGTSSPTLVAANPQPSLATAAAASSSSSSSVVAAATASTSASASTSTTPAIAVAAPKSAETPATTLAEKAPLTEGNSSSSSSSSAAVDPLGAVQQPQKPATIGESSGCGGVSSNAAPSSGVNEVISLNEVVKSTGQLLAFTIKRLNKMMGGVNQMDNNGKTALRIALENGNRTIAHYIKENGGTLGELESSSSGDEQDISPKSNASNLSTPSASPLSMSSDGASTSAAATSGMNKLPWQQQLQWSRVMQLGKQYAEQLGEQIGKQWQTMSPAIIRASKTAVNAVTPTDKKAEFLAKLREVLDRSVRRPLTRGVSPPARGKKYRILCMDGGGIRIALHSVFLTRILQKFPNFLEDTQLFAGCSGSTSFTAALEFGLDPMIIGDLTSLTAEQTMGKAREGNGFTGVRYSFKWMKLAADVLFGDVKLKDLPRHTVMNSYHLDNGHPDITKREGEICFFTNAVRGCGEDEKVCDVVCRSSSAPTFFPAYQGYVDGGVFASNPAACAVPLALGTGPKGVGVDPQDCVCLSLGTGFNHPKFVADQKAKEGGLLQWRDRLFDIFMVSQIQFDDYMCQTMLGDRFLRVNPYIPMIINLDDFKLIPQLKQWAWELPMDHVFDWIQHNWYGPQ